MLEMEVLFQNIIDGSLVPVLTLEIVQLVFNSGIIILNDCYYYSSFLMNVISVSLLIKDGFNILIKNDFCDIIMNDTIIMHGQLKYGIYLLSQSVSVMYTLNKCPNLDSLTNAHLWHCRLDHINKNRINRLTKEKIFNINDCELLSTCESFLLGKMTKLTFIGKGERAGDVLSLVHSDVCGPMNTSICGPMNTSARDGYDYYITFTNDLSRYGYIYLMKHKSESFKMFKRFRNEVEKQTEKNIKTLPDLGGEYLTNHFLIYLEENKILS